MRAHCEPCTQKGYSARQSAPHNAIASSPATTDGKFAIMGHGHCAAATSVAILRAAVAIAPLTNLRCPPSSRRQRPSFAFFVRSRTHVRFAACAKTWQIRYLATLCQLIWVHAPGSVTPASLARIFAASRCAWYEVVASTRACVIRSGPVSPTASDQSYVKPSRVAPPHPANSAPRAATVHRARVWDVETTGAHYRRHIPIVPLCGCLLFSKL